MAARRVLVVTLLCLAPARCARHEAPPSVSAGGLTAASASDGELTLSSGVERWTLGPRRCGAQPAALRGPPRLEQGRLTLDWGWATEQWHPTANGLEWSWRFAVAPADGDLTLRWRVEGATAAAGGLALGELRIGRALWVDSAGLRVPLSLSVEGGEARVRVPADVVGKSRFPAMLDPLVSLEPIDAPVVGPVGRAFPWAAAALPSGTAVLVDHAASFDCVLLDADGGLQSTARVPINGLGDPLTAAASGAQLLVSGPGGYARLSADCQTVLAVGPPTGFTQAARALVALDGGWAQLWSHDTGQALEIGVTAYATDGVVGPATTLRTPADRSARFAAAAFDEALALAVQQLLPDAGVDLEVSLWQPGSWSALGSLTLAPSASVANAPLLASTPGQLLVVWPGGVTSGARRIVPGPSFLDAVDLSVSMNASLAVGAGDRYVLAGIKGALPSIAVVPRVGPVSMAPVLVPDAGTVEACVYVSPGPRSVCLSSVAGVSARTFDLALSDFSQRQPLVARLNQQLRPRYLAGPQGGWVTWLDDRAGLFRLYARPVDVHGRPQATTTHLPVQGNPVFSGTALLDGALVASSDLGLTGTRASLTPDGGISTSPWCCGPSYRTDSAAAGDTLYNWHEFGGACPAGFPVVMTRVTGAGVAVDATEVMLFCRTEYYGVMISSAATDDGLWMLLASYVPADGGMFSGVALMPPRGPAPTTLLPPMGRAGMAARRAQMCFFSPSDGGTDYACLISDGGLAASGALPFAAPEVSGAYDGRRLHLAACIPDAGAWWGALEDDGGIEGNLSNAPCGRISALAPDELISVALVPMSDGDETVSRVQLTTWTQRPAGGRCSSESECLTGFCVDGVCCHTACGFSAADDCQVCSVAAGASTDGECVTLAAPCLPPPDAGTTSSFVVGCGCRSSDEAFMLIAVAAVMATRARQRRSLAPAPREPNRDHHQRTERQR